VSGVLVVGAAGLIGRVVLNEAERSGVAAGAIVGRPSAGVASAHVLRLTADAVDPLARLLERLAPAAIVNCAGRTEGDPDELIDANVEPVRVLVGAMRIAAPRARLVHLGSAAEYAAVSSEVTDEEAPLDASTPYAAAKVAAFHVVADAAASGLDAVTARVFNPIGSGMPESSLPGRATRVLRDALDRGAREVELGPLGALRDYVDLRDVATAVLALATAPRLEHPVYNVGSGRATLVRDLVRLIAARVGFAGAIRESAAASPRSEGVGRRVADTGRIRSLGWVPAVPLRDSVEALVAAADEVEDR
jgi:nucleoside-diphosphate-sugar epimerase